MRMNRKHGKRKHTQHRFATTITIQHQHHHNRVRQAELRQSPNNDKWRGKVHHRTSETVAALSILPAPRHRVAQRARPSLAAVTGWLVYPPQAKDARLQWWHTRIQAHILHRYTATEQLGWDLCFVLCTKRTLASGLAVLKMIVHYYKKCACITCSRNTAVPGRYSCPAVVHRGAFDVHRCDTCIVEHRVVLAVDVLDRWHPLKPHRHKHQLSYMV